MVWVWKSFYIRIFGVLGVSKGLLECPSFCAVSLASCVVNLHPKSDFFTHAFTKPQQCQCGGFFSTTFSILKRVQNYSVCTSRIPYLLCFFKKHSPQQHEIYLVNIGNMSINFRSQPFLFAILDKSSSAIDLHQDSQRKRTTGGPQIKLSHR